MGVPPREPGEARSSVGERANKAPKRRRWGCPRASRAKPVRAGEEPRGVLATRRACVPDAARQGGICQAGRPYARVDASSITVMSEGAPTRVGGPQAPAPRLTYSWVSP
ncbi:hypothetical protein SSP24_55600 [Streptomyces spinoverrucosus]|uniref:Uncharacterized protein n=1 Tax=Streptomyces spinoverrucosus TaxID=284043 RepID=A0A4Y3VPF7_9ACTN|nr:hypothetical protein SSP24_55600 [Streptomyces spinoverrucosus]GHB86006.1 hypothetical protein GCM10010397_66940 [Streptomyces spinoverrucosus]